MNAVQIPHDSENIVQFLAATSLRSAHTREALYQICLDEIAAGEALAWLTSNGYVYEDKGSYELTFSGMHAAQQLLDGTRMTLRTGTSANPSASARSERPTAIPNGGMTATIDTHPMRTSAEHNQRTATHRLSLLYVLAFEAPRDALPVPVLDGDILGRQNDADISLRHDNYISGQHCRFRVSIENKEPTLYVEDLGSRNGTFVDGSRLEPGQLYELKHGSRIHLGSTILIVVKIPY